MKKGFHVIGCEGSVFYLVMLGLVRPPNFFYFVILFY